MIFLPVKYHPYKGWLDEPPKRGAVLIFVFTADAEHAENLFYFFGFR
jgi:hypothetical protein